MKRKNLQNDRNNNAERHTKSLSNMVAFSLSNSSKSVRRSLQSWTAAHSVPIGLLSNSFFNFALRDSIIIEMLAYHYFILICQVNFIAILAVYTIQCIHALRDKLPTQNLLFSNTQEKPESDFPCVQRIAVQLLGLSNEAPAYELR